MKKKKANSARNKKIIIAVAVVVVLIAILVLLSLRPVKNYSEKYAGTNLDVEVKGMERTGTYKQYQLKYPNAAKPNKTIEVNLAGYTATGNVSSYTGEKAVAGSILTDVGSIVTWPVNVPEAGFYYIEMEYLLLGLVFKYVGAESGHRALGQHKRAFERSRGHSRRYREQPREQQRNEPSHWLRSFMARSIARFASRSAMDARLS